MTRVDGLYGHIARNTVSSVGLLAGFIGLISVLWYACCAGYSVLFWRPADVAPSAGIEARIAACLWHALDVAVACWWVPVVVSAAWFAIAYAGYFVLIRYATGASPAPAGAYSKLQAMLERLAIIAGIPKPELEIIPSSELNAYAAGLGPRQAVVAVTRGLIETLEDDELEAVLAHEITHIRNRDVRLMIVSTVFASGLTVIGGLFTAWFGLRATADGSSGLLDLIVPLPSGDDDDDFSLPARVFLLLALCLSGLILIVGLIALVHMFALIAKFAISRSREFMADAGAVELTQNPDALIGALRKISGHDRVPVACDSLRGILFSADPDDLFATHPSIEDRIAALIAHAGGRMRPTKKPKIRKITLRKQWA